MYFIVGLGNPGEEYKNTRHNVGRLAADFVSENLKSNKKKFKVFVPDSFMNKTGSAVAKVVKSKKSAEKLIIIYDELDLPIGRMKISFNRGSGGHKGVESIVKALKTKEFIRIRLGISPTTPSGKLKKPKGDSAVEKFILSDFKKTEIEIFKKLFKEVSDAIEVIVEDGRESAMMRFN